MFAKEDELFGDMNKFFDEAAETYQPNSLPTIIKPSMNVQENVDFFYRRLTELGINTDELKGLLEGKKNLLAISGAGAGKTTAIILKLIRDLLGGELYKMQEVRTPAGLSYVQVPARVLVSTFLNTGAKELEKSFYEWIRKLGISGLDTSGIKFSTIHAEVKSAIEQMGVSVSILNNTDSLVRQVMGKYDVRNVTSTSRNVTVDEVRDIASLFSYARNRLDRKRYEHQLMQDYRLNDVLLNAMLHDFKILRAGTGQMDFEDLQEMLLEASVQNPAVSNFVAERYDFVYVDEFQDTSQLQYELLKFFFNKCKQVVAIGDDDQCLVPGTMIDTVQGPVPIEDIRVGDLVRGGKGYSTSDYFPVVNVARKEIKGEVVSVLTSSGRLIKGTPEHIGFARLEPKAEAHRVYLMYRYDIGCRIGTIRGLGGSLENDMEVLLKRERADKVWLIENTSDLSKAHYLESVYAYGFGVPQHVFEASSSTSDEGVLGAEKIGAMHRALDTAGNGKKLLNSLGMFFDYPHFSAQPGLERFQIEYSLFNSQQVTQANVHRSELSASTTNETFLAILKENLPVTVKQENGGQKDYYRAEGMTSHIDGPYATLKSIRSACKEVEVYLEVNQNAKFTDNKYSFMPLGNFIKGMKVPVTDEYGNVQEEEVVSVQREDYEGYVYDLDVPAVRNFAANGILVHNCIYRWRGSDNGIIGGIFEKDLAPETHMLSTNYRCARNIVEFVKPSIEKNSNRHPKELKAFKEGGVVSLVYNGDVNSLVTGMKKDMVELGRVALLARTNADLLIPALILELDGSVDFALSKSVNMDSRVARQIFGVIDLVLKRNTPEFEGFLKTMIPRYAWHEAEKVAGILTNNKGFNLYNLSMEDLAYSAKTLAPFLQGLRSAKEVGDVEGYLFVLGYMEQNVYVGKSVYNQKGRELVKFVRKLILEHNALKDLTLTQLDDLFNNVIPNKLSNRTKYGNDAFCKLTTVHEAKGKEWDSVYIWNDVEGVFPNVVGNREITEDEFEEERSVHYIACTRAKSKLTIYTDPSTMSEFLKECNLELATTETYAPLPKEGEAVKVFKVKPEGFDAPSTDTLLRKYIADVLGNSSILDPRVANVEVVTSAFLFEDLVAQLENKYGFRLTSQDNQEVMDLFFTGLADEVYKTGNY